MAHAAVGGIWGFRWRRNKSRLFRWDRSLVRCGKKEGGVSWSEKDKPPLSKRLRKSKLFVRNWREGGEGGTNRGC